MSTQTLPSVLVGAPAQNDAPSWSLSRFVKRGTGVDDFVEIHTVNPLQKDVFSQDAPPQCLVNTARLNDMRHVNKFLESANEALENGAYLIGCLETSAVRQARIKPKLPRPFQAGYLFADYLVMRVWPKLPYVKPLYFELTKGRNRVISEMEAYGRLYSCGFKLVKSEEADGKLYFIAQKEKAPAYNMEATYGPTIKLKRVGKGGKIVKVYKLRTMSPFSEYAQQYIYERNGLGDGAKFKDDPRITNAGHFMRKYWIDELPMLFNLLKGDVKLFGVRAISQHYFNLFPEEFRQYRSQFKPGLVPPVYVEVPNSLEDIVDIETRYLKAYQKSPLKTDIVYMGRAFYNIFIKKVRSH
jgi:lipopolysaccharide/colanic/teichoic acid biosynthesis glycosyltransferase